MVTPLTVTVGWLRIYNGHLRAGNSDIESRRYANREAGISGKMYARCELRGYRLTVPLEGGAGVLKHKEADPKLSEHGKWRREHLGAWRAAYGRSPYFIHLFPEIEEVYSRSGGMSLEEFNSRLLEVALGWLDRSIFEVEELSAISKIAAETRSITDESLSVFDLLFRIGPDAIFALLLEEN
ncbi:MAG: WbqC family protein [Muribaculaceae bacterium]|nr:WbqC family protein [Muribaculaceae bacterium]